MKALFLTMTLFAALTSNALADVALEHTITFQNPVDSKVALIKKALQYVSFRNETKLAFQEEIVPTSYINKSSTPKEFFIGVTLNF